MKIYLNRKIILKIMMCIVIVGIGITAVIFKSQYDNSIFQKNDIQYQQIIDTTEIIDKLPIRITEKMKSNGIDISYIFNKYKAYNSPNIYKMHQVFLSSKGNQCNGEYCIKSSNFFVNLSQVNRPLYNKYNLQINTLRLICGLFNKNMHYDESQEFLNIAKEEKQNIIDTNQFSDNNKALKNSDKSYFYQSFSFYFASHETNVFLKSKAPETYEFIKSIVE